MTVTFPRSIPAVGYAFDDPLMLRRFTSGSQSGGRLTNVIEYADPLWMANLTTAPMLAEDMRAVEAWWDSLREGLRTVLFRSPNYAAPRDNRAVPAPALTNGTVSTLTSGNVAVITGVAAGLVLGAGDYLSFAAGTGARALGRVVDSTGAGTSRTVEFEPPLPSTVGVGATVAFDRASLLMRPVRGSFERSKVQDVAFTASFQLMESRA